MAALSVTSTSLATSAASAPNAEPRAESVMVDRNSAIAATPSIDTVMKAMAPAIRSVSWSRLSGAPDSDVAAPPAAWPAVGACPASPPPAAPPPETPGRPAPPGACPTAAAWDGPSRNTPVAYAVNVTASTTSSTYAMTETSLATSSRVRPTGRTSR